MRLCSIASGSSGNCIYVGDERTHLLVDTGISKKRVDEGLTALDVKGEELDGILITHEHIDHIQGLGVFCRRYKTPVYATKGTIDGIKRCSSLGKLPEGILHEISIDEAFRLGELTVFPFAISHDARQPCGYRIEGGGRAAAVATDLGTYDSYIVGQLKNLDGIVLEANHDIHMLEVGGYPYYLKQRILGERGHLSNESAGQLLCKVLHDGLKHIFLGHLSKENNYEELAYETVRLEVLLEDTPYGPDDFPITVAGRDRISRCVSV